MAATKNQTKPEPTAFTVEIANPQTFDVPLPGGVDKLAPGETRTISGITKTKLNQFTANTSINAKVVSDNSYQIAAAEEGRRAKVEDARNRHADLKAALDEARAEADRIEAALVATEDDERAAKGNDHAAMMESGRNPQETATATLKSAGAKSEEIEGLRFDGWGATVRRMRAEAELKEAESVLAADEAVRRRQAIREAESKVEDAQDELAAIRAEDERRYGAPDKLARDARSIRAKAAALDQSGPTRVAS